MKHTPGPWGVVTTGIGLPYIESIDGRKPLATLDSDGACLTYEQIYANADLIAAAPELLEALKVMLASAHPHPVEHPTMTAAWARARAVVAKAEGRAV